MAALAPSVVQPPPPPPAPIFPPAKIKAIEFWLRVFVEDYHGEAPLRLHLIDEYESDGTPKWSPDFTNWVELEEFEGARGRKHDKRTRDQRIRTTRAFRKLRVKAPREFDVLYAFVVHQISIPELAVSMSLRAERLGKPERYTQSMILMLIVSAVDKMSGWWNASG